VQRTKGRQDCLTKSKWGPLAGGVVISAVVLTLTILIQTARPVPAAAAPAGGTAAALSLPVAGMVLADPMVAQADTATTTVGVDTFLPPTAPASESRTPPLPDWVVELQAAGERAVDASVITKMVTTAETAQSTGDSAVYNGDTITFTLLITNDTNVDWTEVLVLDPLPEDTLDSKSIRCDSCQKITKEEVFAEPLGGTIAITTVTELDWSLGLVQANSSVELQFSGKVVGQQDGTLFPNTAYISYKEGTTPKSATSNPTQTTVYVRISEKGRASLSEAPTWFSSDVGGTLSQDWADFDRDGDPDLVLGSSVGTTVYRNDDGQLTPLWDSNTVTYGIRWADVVTTNQQLELLAVGQLAQAGSMAGRNYAFDYDTAEDVFKEVTTLSSEYRDSPFQLLRIVPGDFDRNGLMDLIASTNAIHPDEPVKLFRDLAASGVITGVSGVASANMAAGDANNDDYLELALGAFPNTTGLLWNEGGTVTRTLTVIDNSNLFLPYDFAWGDYDGDGYLDLAAAFPLERKVRIYHNVSDGQGGRTFEPCCRDIRTRSFYTPLSVDWGDFDGDGRLDLAVADMPPKVWTYSAADQGFITILSLPSGSVTGRVWEVRGVDVDNDADLDLVLANQRGPSQIFTAFSPFLSPAITRVPVQTVGASPAASSVAWGDADRDGDLDLLFGAGEPGASGGFGSKVYYNRKGVFDTAPVSIAGFGPQGVAFGDVDSDDSLEIAVVSSGVDKVYSLKKPDWPTWQSDLSSPSNGVAWGDADDDGDLDLLVGNTGQNVLYVNQGQALGPSPAWTSQESDDTRSVAWGDYNNDRYLDFAVGNYGEPTRLYCNNGDDTFTLVWSSTYLSNTTSVAWADYDGDGDLDLSVGNDGEPNALYDNRTCQTYTCSELPFAKKACHSPDPALSSLPIWESDETNQTRSLAWGDWDNDGDLDLAVGNYGEQDQVYGNLSSAPGLPRLAWLWTSNEAYNTTGVAWGDVDGDGDPDLAISQEGGGVDGFYKNDYVVPSHFLTTDFVTAMPLSENRPYLSISRPGTTAAGYFFSTPDLLSGPSYPTVTVQYKVFDPDGTRDTTKTNEEGNPIVRTTFEFSLDGGGTWYPASDAASSAVGFVTTVMTPTRQGEVATFEWDAQADQAISDDARFRICVVPELRLGMAQHASTCATSLPFRVRGVTCEWPANPKITVSYPDLNQDGFEPGKPVQFYGDVTAGSGHLYYSWDFGDGATLSGQRVLHTYTGRGPYEITLTVKGDPCPITREVHATTTLGRPGVYLPLVVRNWPETPATQGTETLQDKVK
jgi:uncharacterized repeat protein (TIGR01451 family)